MDDLDKKLDKIDKDYKENKEEKKPKPKKIGIFDDDYEIVEPPKKEKKEEEEKSKKEVKKESYFDGGLIELIGYKLLGFLITIFTIGIASSWAKCMIIRYKVNHTVLNGNRLKFEGTGSELFIERLKWLLLTIVTLGIFLLWKPLKLLKWEVSHIHFEDEEYKKEDSYFDAGLLKLIGINILCGLLNLFTFGFANPIACCMKIRWIAKHSIINKKKIVFTGNGIKLFLNRLLWGFLTIITFGIFGLWLGIKHMKFYVKNTHIKKVNEEEYKSTADIVVGIVFAVMGVIVAFAIVNILASLFIRTNSDGFTIPISIMPSDNAVGTIELNIKTGSEEVINLIKERNDYSASVRDNVKTLSSIHNDGLRGTYTYTTNKVSNNLSYDINFYVTYQGYYCEQYIPNEGAHDIECHRILSIDDSPLDLVTNTFNYFYQRYFPGNYTNYWYNVY